MNHSERIILEWWTIPNSFSRNATGGWILLDWEKKKKSIKSWYELVLKKIEN